MSEFFNLLGRSLKFISPEQDIATALQIEFDPYLVILSTVIAIFASYAAFALAIQIRSSTYRITRGLLLLVGAIALGGGTWTMHFLGMLSWQPSTAVNYDINITILSAVPAIITGAVSLFIIGNLEQVRFAHTLVGGVLVGSGIGLMHYSGMAALQMDAVIYYDPKGFALSIVAAVVLSICSLHFANKAIDKGLGLSVHAGIICAAILMGTAMSIMHYIGMAASYCFSAAPAHSDGADVNKLASIVGFAAMSLLAITIVASNISQRLRVIPILEREIAKRRDVEADLRVHREALRKSHNELEERVQQRTQELSLEISERKRVEAELVMAMSQAEKANQMKTTFLSHMSHEFRTPLNGIIGYLEFLSTDSCKNYSYEKIQSILSEMHKASVHLATLIDDVLDISRIEAGMEEVHEDVLELGYSIKNCLELIQIVAEKKNIAVGFMEYAMPVFATCDKKHFKQILLNIISNAINYTKPGGKVHIEMGVIDDDIAAVTISDTGVGIPEAEIERVFQDFERSMNPMLSTTSGTGLGLPLTKRLIELNGGHIDLRSIVNKGTTVTIHLRLALKDQHHDEQHLQLNQA